MLLDGKSEWTMEKEDESTRRQPRGTSERGSDEANSSRCLLLRLLLLLAPPPLLPSRLQRWMDCLEHLQVSRGRVGGCARRFDEQTATSKKLCESTQRTLPMSEEDEGTGWSELPAGLEPVVSTRGGKWSVEETSRTAVRDTAAAVAAVPPVASPSARRRWRCFRAARAGWLESTKMRIRSRSWRGILPPLSLAPSSWRCIVDLNRTH